MLVTVEGRGGFDVWGGEGEVVDAGEEVWVWKDVGRGAWDWGWEEHGGVVDRDLGVCGLRELLILQM